jgi:hypothetical protein
MKKEGKKIGEKSKQNFIFVVWWETRKNTSKTVLLSSWHLSTCCMSFCRLSAFCLFAYCTASHKPFLYRKRPSQQNGERRKRNEKEDYLYVECKQLQGHLHPSPPSRCDNGGSCSRLISGPSPPHTPHSRIIADSGSLGQNWGWPPFRSLWVV